MYTHTHLSIAYFEIVNIRPIAKLELRKSGWENLVFFSISVCLDSAVWSAATKTYLCKSKTGWFVNVTTQFHLCNFDCWFVLFFLKNWLTKSNHHLLVYHRDSLVGVQPKNIWHQTQQLPLPTWTYSFQKHSLWLHVGFRWCILPLFLEKDNFLSTFPANPRSWPSFCGMPLFRPSGNISSVQAPRSHCRFCFCI